ncbi:MAG: non-heme iron oxygenase ferredoxin subunit [Frankia sp.]|nr:non-heme iron oxygenase ferredoxin subunit [Frankia sp.]
MSETTQRETTQTWVRVCGAGDVPDEGALHVDIGAMPVCIAHSEGRFYAIYDVCSHAEVALSEGEVEEGTVECWLHGSRFDLATGHPTGLPATRPVPVFPVKLDGDDVLVAVEEPQS